MAEPTAEQQAAFEAQQLRERQDEEMRERVRRGEIYLAFIGGRRIYESCRLDAWQFADDPTKSARQRVVIAAVQDYVAAIESHLDAGVGALFYGPPGTGKDFLATCIVRDACLVHGHSAKFLNGVDWFVTLRDAMDDDRKSESALIRECVRPHWLILSDPLPPIGSLTNYQASMLYRLVDERTSQRRPTIVTINVFDSEEAVARMGGPTWDRLKQDTWVFACNWPSFRKPVRVI